MRFQIFVNNGQTYRTHRCYCKKHNLPVAICCSPGQRHQRAWAFRHLSTTVKHTQPSYDRKIHNVHVAEEFNTGLSETLSTIVMLPFAAHQVDSVRGHALAEDLAPGVRCDLGELELGVVGVHAVDLLPGGGSQHLYDLHQLVHPALPCSHI